MITYEHASGENDEYIDYSSLGVPVHGALVAPFKEARQLASEAGIALGIVSGYRSFESQLAIWNAKARGERVLLDQYCRPMEFSGLDKKSLLFAILRWSALPGSSRHHWGCDIDVVDENVVSAGYQTRLTVDETVAGGAFFKLHRWLKTWIASGNLDFYRPFNESFAQGVSPEPWHLSYSPLANQYSVYMQKDALFETVRKKDIELKDQVLQNFDVIFNFYIARYCQARREN